MRHDLSPLHVSESVLWIGDVLLTESDQRNDTGIGQLLASNGHGRQRDTITVLGRQQTTVPTVRRTPGRVLQVIARAIQGAVARLLACRWCWALRLSLQRTQERYGVAGFANQRAVERCRKRGWFSKI